MLCFAPTRSGKGVGLVVPTLLIWPGSAIVHDIKGENWTLKITCPPFAVTGLIYAGRWDGVQEACEVDVISTALLLARWRRLTDARAEADAVEDRILRRAIELREGRGYVAAIEAHRRIRFAASIAKAANDAVTLASWLDTDAA